MNIKKKIAGAVVALFLVIIISLIFSEPLYPGKKGAAVGLYIKQLQSPDNGLKIEALEALAGDFKMSGRIMNAVSTLFEDPDAVVRDRAFLVLYNQAEKKDTLSFKMKRKIIDLFSGYSENSSLAETRRLATRYMVRTLAGTYSEEKAMGDRLKMTRKYVKDLKAWENRREEVRRHLLKVNRLWPMPPKGELAPVITEVRDLGEYMVQDLYLEAFPGIYSTGSLYIPRDRKGPVPGIVAAHGHFGDQPGGRFREDAQNFYATLARMGAVVFVYDHVGSNSLVGWGESNQVTHEDHFCPALRLWFAFRAVDFLYEHEYVDSGRIAFTGVSSGGTMAILAAALDERITVAAPVVPSLRFFGCWCEISLPITHGRNYRSHIPEIAGLVAPRPLLLVSIGWGFDSTAAAPELEFPYIRNIYDLYNAGRQAENIHVMHGHELHLKLRAPVFRFLATRLKLDYIRVLDKNGDIDESKNVIEERETLLVYSDDFPRPVDAFKGRIEDIPGFLQGEMN